MSFVFIAAIERVAQRATRRDVLVSARQKAGVRLRFNHAESVAKARSDPYTRKRFGRIDCRRAVAAAGEKTFSNRRSPRSLPLQLLEAARPSRKIRMGD